MASIDIGKLVQESIMTAKDNPETQQIQESSIDISKIEEGIMDKLKAAGSKVKEVGQYDVGAGAKKVMGSAKSTAQKYTGIGKNSRTMTSAEVGARKLAGKAKESAGAAYSTAKDKTAQAAGATKDWAKKKPTVGQAAKTAGITAGVGTAALAGGAGLMKHAEAQRQKHAEALRAAAKEKMAAAMEKRQAAAGATQGMKEKAIAKAQSMGSHLKELGKQAMEKVKENPKAAAGIAAGTAGALGAGLAAKKLLAMRKARRAAA